MKYRQYLRGIKLSGFSDKMGKPQTRGDVRSFSDASKKRLEWVYMQYNWASMITLTYHSPDVVDWRLCKKQLNAFLQSLRRRKIKYLWALEWQSRGVPHFHVWMDCRFRDQFDGVTCFDRNGKEYDPTQDYGGRYLDSWKPIMRSWLRVSNQSSDKQAVKVHMHTSCIVHWKVHSNSCYASKYASKSQQKGLPKGISQFGRWWGCSNKLNLEVDEVEVSQDDSPEKISQYKQFRRNVKRYIEHVYRYRYRRGWDANRPIRWTMPEYQIRDIVRLKDVYLLVNEPLQDV